MTRDRRFGPAIGADGVTFRLWAPDAKSVALKMHGKEEDIRPMQRDSEGWFSIVAPDARPGTRYRFRIDDEIDVPDPASGFQPEDVNGPSEVIDPAFGWQAAGWKGRPWHECVFLEMHTGTFTTDGTFRAAIDKLDHVVEAGFTAIELMPVADFAGRWNWGYDGVLLFAPDSAYGRPDDLKALIDAAHGKGLMVFLDVVYNHFGPEGNYLGRYAPQFFTPANTPWGSAIDYGNPLVRRFAIENALYWLDEFRFDGLRLDAVHAIVEPGRGLLLRKLSEAAGALIAESGRHIHLVLENDANQASLLDPVVDPPVGKYRAQWNDDYHHAFHVALTGETTSYYADYRDPAPYIARVLAQGFAYQGEPSPHRGGEPRGETTAKLPLTAFVNFLQNHDQIGNRALGERLTGLATPEALEAALAITLLAPGPPLMFMGDEWAAREPFPFFCDFKGDLAQAVREGRRREFSEAYEKYRDEVPDPLAEETVRLATLDWSVRSQSGHTARLTFVKDLLGARKAHITPRLPHLMDGHGTARFEDGVLIAQWRIRPAERLSMLANFSLQARERPHAMSGHAVWGGPPPDELPPWSVFVWIGPS
ncbi:malto-oligosyltrehalose trehalohydrolase [Rhodoplanes sp. Z2-YC6860]|uniref:malto-oligosyltrehalose trehalohydrolase n=1 Tax=Rhodoplanes sp. Z2-YC6860 TaxID=674703 RepID=UPI00078EE0F3|nr:malto-oligosyltrehalose trehalohydrolase [Rhodoplanes sp. Z2-YC6860]AMN43948.1 malto-oligosyltrehalose trehalohydrolase [Rhodoplanes sp. Z2-YC6860]